jgi:hypothetical protein
MSMSIRQFARHLGVTDGAIRKAIKSGRIPSGDLGTIATKTGITRPVIDDPVSAAYNFRRNTDHSRTSIGKPLEPGVADDIAKFRAISEKAKAMHEAAKYQRYVGELIGRQDAQQAATLTVHTALNNLRKAVRAKRLAKDELLAAIDACELEIMDAMEKRFASDADESSS